MESNNINEDKPKKSFDWGYLYKVYIVVLIAVFILALANQADAGVFLEINSQMEYYDSQIQMSDVIYNADVWDGVANYMNDVHGFPFPSYSEATAMDDLLENVLMYYVGQYCNLSGTAAQQVYETCTDIADTASQVWDMISLDLDSGDFIVNPRYSNSDLSNVIHGAVDPIIYDEGSTDGPVVGNWYSVPWTFSGSNFSCAISDVSTNSAPVYVCLVDSGWNYGIYVASFVQSQSASIKMSTISSTTTLTTSARYQGSVSVGFYSSSYGMSGAYRPSGIAMYSNINTALADLFGQEWTPPSADPYLNGEGYIINENPTYAPLSGFSALNYPYRIKIVDNHTSTTDPEDPVGYPSGVNTVEPNPKYTDIPTWLVDPSMEFPEEPDYLGELDVEQPEFESDPTFIQTVYESLPSGIVLMISVSLGLGIAIKIIS